MDGRDVREGAAGASPAGRARQARSNSQPHNATQTIEISTYGHSEPEIEIIVRLR